MKLFQNLILFLLLHMGFGWQNQYKVIQENFTLEYIDETVMIAEFGVYKFNKTIKALNFTLTPQIVLPDDTKVAVVAYKWLNNAYRLGFLEIRKTFKQVTEMEMFDLQGVFVKHCRPPLIWPLEKGLTYRSVGWYPDSTSFPSHMPGGKYKFELKVTFANNTQFILANYYSTIVYK